MHACVSVYPFLQSRRRRAFFWSQTTQHVSRWSCAVELARGLLALGALAAWVSLVVVIAA